jgi:hypothetical protein
MNYYDENSYSSSGCGGGKETAPHPFLDAELSDQISIDVKLSHICPLFEPYLYLIDEQDNFFNIDFMTNYIAYILLVRIKSSSLLSQLNMDIASELTTGNTTIDNKNMLKEISRQIFVESEIEPCGLKGCKMNIFIESDRKTMSSDQIMNENGVADATRENFLLAQFRFDESCSLTTFELNLCLKQSSINNIDKNRMMNNDSSSSTSQLSSSFASTLTKKLFGGNSKRSSSGECTTSQTSKPLQHASGESASTDNNNQQEKHFIYLDPINYNLFKCKLY